MRTSILLLSLAVLAWSKPITLAWDKNPETNITGYRVNYGTDSSKLEKSATVPADKTEVEIDLPLGEYWFNIVAIAGSNESVPSRAILGVVREPENLGWLVRSDWKLTASSESPPKYALDFATDDDLASFWHIHFIPENAAPPHWLAVELPEPATLFGLYAQPRSDGFKGSNITDYQIESSSDGVTWVPWASGTWTAAAELKKAELPMRQTKFVRIVSNGVQASIAELNLLGYYGQSEEGVTPVQPAPPGKLRVVRIETSANLTDWEPLAFVPLVTDSPARFIRANISEITP